MVLANIPPLRPNGQLSFNQTLSNIRNTYLNLQDLDFYSNPHQFPTLFTKIPEFFPAELTIILQCYTKR